MKNYSLDTKVINNHANTIIQNLQEESLSVYVFLQEQWNSTSAIENTLFQFVFRSFYRIDNAGLTDEFKIKYFELLEGSRNSNPNLRDICKCLYTIPNRKGLNSLQFSFATKLANTVDSSLPIFDSEVAKVYNFKVPASVIPIDNRLNTLLSFYQNISDDYERIIKSGSLDYTISMFDEKFSKYSTTIGQNKKLDFIVWSAGKILNK